jgi:hypothetical protein
MVLFPVHSDRENAETHVLPRPTVTGCFLTVHCSIIQNNK